MRVGHQQQMIVRQDFPRIDPPFARHAEMEDERIAAIAVDQPIFGAAVKAHHDRPRQPLAQIGRDGAAQIGTARLTRAFEHRRETANGSFDLGEFGHVKPLACCPALG